MNVWLEYAKREQFGGSRFTSPEMGRMLRNEFGFRLSKPSYSAAGRVLGDFDWWWTTRTDYNYIAIRVFEGDRWEFLRGPEQPMKIVATDQGAMTLRGALADQGSLTG